jgi:hypothetical protein
MASDVLFGWLLGMATVGGPLIFLKFRDLQKQIAFLRGNGKDVAQEELPESH